MEVNFEYYLTHYLQKKELLTFFVLALGILFVFFVGFYLYTVATAGMVKKSQRREYIRIEWHVLVERFYEMIFSGTSILFFIAAYYLINRFVTMEPYRGVWDKYKDFFLMLLITLSCFYNSFLDRIFVRFKFLNREEKSAGRLTGMLYMILIFCYIKFIYEDDNYDMFITYFLGLMVGRFVYFDTSVHDFVRCINGVRKNIGLLICALTYTAIMCLYGFKTGYLITHNGVITNVFIAHLFMCSAIFVLHHSHIAELVTGRGGRQPRVTGGMSEYDERMEYVNDESYEYEDDYADYEE